MSRRIMSRKFVLPVALSVMLGVISGCSTTDDGGFSFSHKNDNVSPAYAAASKSLEKPERAFLSYAEWKADIGQIAEARTAYENVLSSNPKSVEALVGLANVEVKAGRTKEAENQYKQAVSLNPSNAKALHSLGQFYAGQKRIDEAIDMLGRAVAEEPTSPAYRFELGVALAKAGQVNEGLSHLALTVGEAEANYNIGYLLNEQGKSSQAMPYLRQAITLKPDLKQAHDLVAGIANGSAQKKLANTVATRMQPPRRPVPATNVAMTNYRVPTPGAAPQQQQQQQYAPQQVAQQQYVQQRPPVQQQQQYAQQPQYAQPQHGPQITPAQTQQVKPMNVPANNNYQTPGANGYRAPQPAAAATRLLPQGQPQYQQPPVMPLPQARYVPPTNVPTQGQTPGWKAPARRQVKQTIQQVSGTQSAPASTGLTPTQLEQLWHAAK